MFFFQAEDGIRDLVRSRGLGDVYKRQVVVPPRVRVEGFAREQVGVRVVAFVVDEGAEGFELSLIHI